MSMFHVKAMLLLTIILISLNSILVSSDPIFELTKYHVVIQNGMQASQGIKVHLHCMSKDDDLGIQALAPDEQFEWGFKTALFGSTLFSCIVFCKIGHKEFVTFKDDPDFTNGCGGKHCIWKAKEGGIYLFNIPDKKYNFVYNWETYVASSQNNSSWFAKNV